MSILHFLSAIIHYPLVVTEAECDCSRWFRAKHAIHHAMCNLYKTEKLGRQGGK